MSQTPTRRAQVTIAHLMAVVAAFALAFAWPFCLPAVGFVIVCYSLDRSGDSRLVELVVVVSIVAVMIGLLFPAVPTNCQFRPPAPAVVSTAATTPAPAPAAATAPAPATRPLVGPIP